MSCFNYGHYLPSAINSILAQSYSDLELIITDDCSTDQSRDIIAEFQRLDQRVVPVLHKTNSGVACARNSALSVSSGDLIAFCDADDVWMPDKLKIQVEALRKKPEAGVAHSDTIIIDSCSNPTSQLFSSLMHRKGQQTSGDVFQELCQRNFICLSTVVMRRAAMHLAGGFQPRLPPLEDWVCWTVISKEFQFAYSDEPLAFYRIHGASLSQNAKRMASSRAKALVFLMECLPNLTSRARSGMLYSLGMSQLELSDPGQAAESFFKSIKADPRRLRSWARCCQAAAGLALSARPGHLPPSKLN